tara:strand:+ start:37023 stop:37340 length:318 start_codon:yes stop_codon:yes gene_type:complete
MNLDTSPFDLILSLILLFLLSLSVLFLLSSVWCFIFLGLPNSLLFFLGCASFDAPLAHKLAAIPLPISLLLLFVATATNLLIHNLVTTGLTIFCSFVAVPKQVNF